MKELRNDPCTLEAEQANDIEALLAEYNKQVSSDGKHSYSETLHNDDSSGCCCCDLCTCGCDTLSCLTNC